jgi:hypothetical protein
MLLVTTTPASWDLLTAEREDADAGGVGVRHIHIIIEENARLAKPPNGKEAAEDGDIVSQHLAAP